MDPRLAALLQQMMADGPDPDAVARQMLERFGLGEQAASVEDWMLAALPDPVHKHKQRAEQQYKRKEVAGALASYQAAAASAGAGLAWPQVESLVLTCRSNTSLCLLHLCQPAEAVAECDANLALPGVHGSDLLLKILMRKLQGLIDSARPRVEILAFVEQLRRRGAFDAGAPQLGKAVEQVARLSEAPSAAPPSAPSTCCPQSGSRLAW
jgi:hypothetical protein